MFHGYVVRTLKTMEESLRAVRLEDFIKKEIRESWIREKGMTVFSLFDPKNPFFLLDIFVEMPFNFDVVYEEREERPCG